MDPAACFAVSVWGWPKSKKALFKQYNAHYAMSLNAEVCMSL